MHSAYDTLKTHLSAQPRNWLVTGVAGFIGSNILEQLLSLGQHVVGLDNFATGHQHNLDDVRRIVGAEAWCRFRLIEGDICRPEICGQACQGADFVLHQAALGSVPRSLQNPLATHNTNVTGFVNMLLAARDAEVQRVVYASSSSVYGDHPGLPKVEHELGNALSPYAASKYTDEVYAAVFSRCFDLRVVGLRYFNVFGPRQDPEGAYAAVIPKWLDRLLRQEVCQIYGDGETSRDFTYVANAVQANLLAATSSGSQEPHRIFNVACGERMTLKQLFSAIRAAIQSQRNDLELAAPQHIEFRQGDVRHSLADTSKIAAELGFQPTHMAASGLAATVDWYLRAHAAAPRAGEGRRRAS